jgi:hypothetical protein
MANAASSISGGRLGNNVLSVSLSVSYRLDKWFAWASGIPTDGDMLTFKSQKIAESMGTLIPGTKILLGGT